MDSFAVKEEPISYKQKRPTLDLSRGRRSLRSTFPQKWCWDQTAKQVKVVMANWQS